MTSARNSFKLRYNKLAANYREDNRTILALLFKSNSTVKGARHGAGKGPEEAAATYEAT